MRSRRARASPGARRSSPTAAWSRGLGRPTAHGMAPAARRAATPLARGPSRKRRGAFASTTRQPRKTSRRAPPDPARARPGRSWPTRGDGRSLAGASLKQRSTRSRVWRLRAGGPGAAWRLTGATGARGTPPAPRAERSGASDMRPHPRCLGPPSRLASGRVEWRSVPRQARAATCPEAWLTVRPRPQAHHSLDGRRACRARGVDGDGTRAPPCVPVAPGNAPGAAAAGLRRPEPHYVCGAGPLLVPKPADGTPAEAVTRPKVHTGSGANNASRFRAGRRLPLDRGRPYKGSVACAYPCLSMALPSRHSSIGPSCEILIANP
jgi:hypothetical protein